MVGQAGAEGEQPYLVVASVHLGDESRRQSLRLLAAGPGGMPAPPLLPGDRVQTLGDHRVPAVALTGHIPSHEVPHPGSQTIGSPVEGWKKSAHVQLSRRATGVRWVLTPRKCWSGLVSGQAFTDSYSVELPEPGECAQGPASGESPNSSRSIVTERALGPGVVTLPVRAHHRRRPPRPPPPPQRRRGDRR